MKRIHLFEFEDLAWFPDWIRQCMTQYIKTLHRVADTPSVILPLVERGLDSSQNKQIIDLCSGAGGPMVDVVQRLNSSTEKPSVHLTLTDLYPNLKAVESLERDPVTNVRYCRQPTDAANVPEEMVGMRTMICSLHHMSPEVVKSILSDTASKKQPFLAMELSENSAPLWLWWLAIPVGFLLSLFLTLRVRPLSTTQLIFTYCLPILPLFLSWDGAVSNARTYTKQDLEYLLSQIHSQAYSWEIGTVKNARLPGKMSYLLGLPVKVSS